MSKVILDWDKSRNKGVIVSDHLDLIRHHFSRPNTAKQAIVNRGFRAPDRFHYITATGRFDIGMTFTIIQTIKSSKYQFECQVTDQLSEQIQLKIECSDIATLNLTPRPYQIDAVKKALKYGFGTFKIGTGGGKTLLMALIDQTIRPVIEGNTLLCLPAHLVEQTKKDFISYGIPEKDIAQWSMKHTHEIKPIIIASYSTLTRKLNSKDKQIQKEYIKKLDNVSLLMFDEVHQLKKGNKLNKTLDKLKQCRHRFGFTGTLPEDIIDQWNIIGKIGPLLSDISSYELREQGYLSNVNALLLKINYYNPPEFKSTIEEPNKAYQEEKQFISTNKYRRKVCKKLCSNFDNNCLIIVDRKEHGELLHQEISKLESKQCYWIYGDVDVDEREKVRELMEQQTNIVCIAMAKIFSTGINIENLHYIIFANGGKAKVTIIQSIGRGLRLHPSKENLLIVDMADMLRYGKDHLHSREQHYNKEKIPYEIREINEPFNNN